MAQKHLSVESKFANRAFMATALGIVTALIYLGALRNGFVAYDDPDHITANPHVLGGVSIDNIKWALTTPATGNWFPLTWMSHMIDVSIYGTAAWGHHLTNILLHALNAAILFLALAEVTRAKWRSAAAAALFAWHPLRVESVAWASERKDVLCGLFFMLTIWAYAKYARVDSGQPARKKMAWYAVVVLLLALGLMAKPMLVTTPFVLLLLDWWPLGRWGRYSQTTKDPHPNPLPEYRARGKIQIALLLEKLPLVGLVIASCVITFLVQRGAGSVAEVKGNYSLANRFANAIVAYARYVGKTVWPVDLAVFYPHPGAWPMGVVVLAGAVIVAITMFAIVMARPAPYLIVGWLWFVGMLVPVIGIVQVGWQSMADRYAYLPGIGMGVLIVWGGGEMMELLNRKREERGAAGRAVVVSFVMVASIFVCLTIHQISFWKDTLTLFSHALDVTSDNFLADGYVGSELSARGDVIGAEAHFREAVRLNPEFADAQANWGNLLLRQGKFAEAIPHFNEALRLRPEYSAAHNNLGIALIQTGDATEAEKHFAEAVRITPEWEDARCNWAAALARLGKVREAAEQYRKVLEVDSANARAENGLERLETPGL